MSKQHYATIRTPEGDRSLPVCPYCDKPIEDGKRGGITKIDGYDHWVCKKFICIARLKSDFVKSRY